MAPHRQPPPPASAPTSPSAPLAPSGPPSGSRPSCRQQRRHRGAGLRSALQRRNQRVERHLALVRPIACHYAGLSPEPRDDLSQVGLLGLLRAAELYRSDQGVPFEAFARPHIRGAILHYLRDHGSLVRVSRRRQELERRLAVACGELAASGAGRPAPALLRQALGLSEQQWLALQTCPARVQVVPLERIGEPEAPDSEPAAEGPGEALAVLGQLGGRPQQAVEAVVLQGESLRQVARRWHTSPSTVHRQLRLGLELLRRRLASPSGAPAC